MDPKYATSGPDEQEELARYFQDRFGMKVLHADPAELTLKKDEVYYAGECIDLVYRDYTVYDLIESEKVSIIAVNPGNKVHGHDSSIGPVTDKECPLIFRRKPAAGAKLHSRR